MANSSDMVEINKNGPGIGIITLWTKKEDIKKSLDNNSYFIIGNLYSKNKGINILLRSLLLNKNIRDIIITGKDLGGGGDALIKLFKYGIDKNNNIKNTEHATIDKVIPKEKIELVKNNVIIHDLRECNIETLKKKIIEIKEADRKSYGEPEEFPEEKIETTTYPTDISGFKIIDSYVGNCWLKILDTVLRFGKLKQSEYYDNQIEVLNIIATITEEDTKNIRWKPYFIFSKDDLERYYPQVLSPKEFEGIEYTYGIRLMDHNNVNQIETMIKKLSMHKFSRRAMAVTWNVTMDNDADKSPCLVLVQGTVEDEKLYLTAYFRSNDMCNAWPRNAFALRKLQEKIANDVKVGIGSLTIISNSAHIYEKDISDVKEILKENKIVWKLEDYRGNLIISIVEKDNSKNEHEEKGKVIQIEHRDNEGKTLDYLYGKTAKELMLKLHNNQKISRIDHAMDIGAELQKAEIALEKGIKYKQDNKLEF